ncbi:MAG TPA: alpha/beta hydrolase [Candidatus Eremiobacteraceae bacterium]|nr:alpha/beta hydrolase [Candidatus Eremiobacteraceae bacterium]
MTASRELSFAESDGLRLAYVEAGDGPPVVFLHGVGATKRSWEPQLSVLAERFRCIALDYRGYGDSQVPPEAALAPAAREPKSISRAAFARDVFAVLDAAKIDAAHLCGCSLGGVVALEAYSAKPARVRSLALVDTFAFHPEANVSVDERIEALDSLGIEEFAATRTPLIVRPEATQAELESVRSDLASIPLAVYKAATRVTWTGDYRSLLDRISVPAEVFWGEFDTQIAPLALSEELARGIPTCSGVVRVPHAGHLANIDNPDFFNLALEAFVDSVEAGFI